MNLHHRDTEDAEKEVEAMFVDELKIVSVISVPPWWFFTGHDQTLRVCYLRFRIQFFSYLTHSSLRRQAKNLPFGTSRQTA